MAGPLIGIVGGVSDYHKRVAGGDGYLLSRRRPVAARHRHRPWNFP